MLGESKTEELDEDEESSSFIEIFNDACFNESTSKF